MPWDRLAIVLGVLLVMGGVGAVAVWWVQGNRKLWEQRDIRGLMRRRRALWRSGGLVIGVVLLAVAVAGAAYVYARGGVLAP